MIIMCSDKFRNLIRCFGVSTLREYVADNIIIILRLSAGRQVKSAENGGVLPICTTDIPTGKETRSNTHWEQLIFFTLRLMIDST